MMSSRWSKAAVISVLVGTVIGVSVQTVGQGTVEQTQQQVQATEETPAGTATQAEAQHTRSWHQVIKKYFIDGGPLYMGITLLCLIVGLAFAIERMIYLSLSTINVPRLLREVEEALAAGDVERARQACRRRRGPVAGVLLQALERVNEGLDVVERTITSYASVTTGLLERNMVWISLFISLAPMLGFLGTVIGMIQAFEAIEMAGDISPSLVAGGIKVALLTTLLGLIIAVVLQVFYNYLISRIEGLVSQMEDAAIDLVDMLLKYRIVKQQ